MIVCYHSLWVWEKVVFDRNLPKVITNWPLGKEVTSAMKSLDGYAAERINKQRKQEAKEIWRVMCVHCCITVHDRTEMTKTDRE